MKSDDLIKGLTEEGPVDDISSYSYKTFLPQIKEEVQICLF
jgi:hypothetical protein